jgi:cytochrome o ubiquinol oxidase operon protein cyoD
MIDAHHGWNRKIGPVLIGFVLSVLCTLGAYALAMRGDFDGNTRLGLIIGLGVLQTFFQLIFFFHLGVEEKPRWNVMMFLFMLLVVVLVIGGSIWIMNNLNYYVMPMMSGSS